MIYIYVVGEPEPFDLLPFWWFEFVISYLKLENVKQYIKHKDYWKWYQLLPHRSYSEKTFLVVNLYKEKMSSESQHNRLQKRQASGEEHGEILDIGALEIELKDLLYQVMRGV